MKSEKYGERQNISENNGLVLLQNATTIRLIEKEGYVSLYVCRRMVSGIFLKMIVRIH